MTELGSIDAGEEGCAYLTGELTFESVPDLYQRARNIMSGLPATVDLSKVTIADSAGLALLLEWQASRQAPAEPLKYINAPSSLMSLASLSEATELLNLSGREVKNP